MEKLIMKMFNKILPSGKGTYRMSVGGILTGIGGILTGQLETDIAIMMIWGGLTAIYMRRGQGT